MNPKTPLTPPGLTARLSERFLLLQGLASQCPYGTVALLPQDVQNGVRGCGAWWAPGESLPAAPYRGATRRGHTLRGFVISAVFFAQKP